MYTEEERAKWRQLVARWKAGEKVFDAGKRIEKADATTVQRQEPVQPIKRNFIAEAQRKHAAETVGPDTRSSYQRKQSQDAKQYANQQHQKAKDDAKRAEGMEQLMKTISPSTYVEAAIGQDLGAVGRLATDATVFGLPSVVKSAGKSIGRQILKNQIKSEFKRGVNRASVINDIFENSPVLYDSGGNLLDYNDYLNKLFPNSKIKDILWHGSRESNLQSFDFSKIGSNMPIKGSVAMYLTPSKNVASSYGSGGVYPVLLNTETPHITNQFFGGFSKNGVNVTKITPRVRSTILSNNDAVIAPLRSEIAFFNPDDALILGSQSDRNQFAGFMQSLNRKAKIQDGYVYKNNTVTPGEHKYYGQKINYSDPNINELSDYQLDDMMGDYVGRGAERTVYQDLRNNNRLLKITDGGSPDVQITNQSDLLDYIEESLRINKLPEVPQIAYEGFIKDGDRFLPVFSQQKVTPMKKVADPFQIFTKQYVLPNGKTPSGKLSAIRKMNPDAFSRIGYKPITSKPGVYSVNGTDGNYNVTDLGQKNVGIDALGNLKIFDPMFE